MITTTPGITRHRRLQARLAAIFLLILPCSAASHTPRFPDANVIRGRTAAGYPYLNGGISFDEQRAMERAAGPFNLKVVFARRSGTPVAPNFVVIGANNGSHIDKISIGAPWFYIQLPPGGYTILARFRRQVVLLRDVKIGEGRRSTYFLRGD
jgi:hypothetical protein